MNRPSALAAIMVIGIAMWAMGFALGITIGMNL